ncbi:thioesterase domain-containing protein [Streptomyces sp. NPDC046727]|uniref:thioesterase II family protein n=1 Tax=Streptomyces sp. NPDC046727 TaxID=3155373 RepID=UPI003403489E
MLIRSVSDKPEASLHIVGFPGAGSSRAHFMQWDQLLGPQARLSVVDPWLLYFEQEKKGLGVLGDVAALLAAELRELRSPALLVGHSRGSLLAYETAQQLTAAGSGDRVAGLVAMAHRAPTTVPTYRLGSAGTEQLQRFLEEMGGTPPEIFADPELLGMVLDRLRSELTMSENYRHTWPRPLDCPLRVYLGDADGSVPHTESDRWQDVVTGRCTSRTFSGGHFFPFGDTAGHVVETLLNDFILAGDAHGL